MREKTGTWKKCVTCGNKIYIQKYQMNRKKYCSNSCKAKSPEAIERAIKSLQNIDNKGENNPRYIDGRWIYRRVMLSLKPNKCEICDREDEVLVHHKNGNRKDNRIINLIVLCYSCHNLIHKLKNKKSKEIKKILYYSKKLIGEKI